MSGEAHLRCSTQSFTQLIYLRLGMPLPPLINPVTSYYSVLFSSLNSCIHTCGLSTSGSPLLLNHPASFPHCTKFVQLALNVTHKILPLHSSPDFLYTTSKLQESPFPQLSHLIYHTSPTQSCYHKL